MTQRHVTEGRDRIFRQETLIARLQQAGHENMLPKASELLSEMRKFQATAEAHLARALAEDTGGKSDHTTP